MYYVKVKEGFLRCLFAIAASRIRVMINILFLCTANIQRSKTAEEIFNRIDKTNEYRSSGLSHKHTQKMGSTLCTEKILEWLIRFMCSRLC